MISPVLLQTPHTHKIRILVGLKISQNFNLAGRLCP
jgi:hypothetical protein